MTDLIGEAMNEKELIREVADLRRELEKALDTLSDAETYFRCKAEMNAAMHRAPRVRYSPLHSTIESTIESIEGALSE